MGKRPIKIYRLILLVLISLFLTHIPAVFAQSAAEFVHLGNVCGKQGKYKEALEAYQRVVDAYGEDIYGDDALFKMAEIYQYNLKDIEKAKATYQEVLTKYPSSVYTVEARKRFRKLRGDVVN